MYYIRTYNKKQNGRTISLKICSEASLVEFAKIHLESNSNKNVEEVKRILLRVSFKAFFNADISYQKSMSCYECVADESSIKSRL